MKQHEQGDSIPANGPVEIDLNKSQLITMTVPNNATYSAAPPLRGDYVFDDGLGNELLRITPKEFIFRGESIQDAGKAYEAFTYMLEAKGCMPIPISNQMRAISFIAEQEALVRESPHRAEQMMVESIDTPPGYIRIHRKRSDWFLSIATQETIPAKIEQVRKFLNKGNPKPFSEEQLRTVYLVKDQRRLSDQLTVMIKVAGIDDVAVAFVSGPLVDLTAEK